MSVAIFDNGDVSVNGANATPSDLVMAAGLLSREADHAFNRMKMAQAMAQNKIQPVQALPGLKARD